MKARKVLSLMLAVVLMLSFCVTSAGASTSADVIEVAAGKGGAEAGANTWDFDNDTIWTESNNWPINRVTDGDETTSWAVHGGGNHAMGAINLGQKYKITKVEVLAYNSVDPGRGAGFEIALSNFIPHSDETEATYTSGKLTLGTMPYRDDRTSAATGYDTFVVDYTAAGADAEGYQYVCLEEMTDGVAYVAEVKVYVANEGNGDNNDEDDTTETPTPEQNPNVIEIAAGKGATEYHKNTWDFDMGNAGTESSNQTLSRLTDGDESNAWSVHGGGNHAMGWIDLGQTYKIHHVEVLAYSSVDPGRGANFDVTLSNVVPTSVETAADYTAAKLTLGTMPYRDDRTTAATGYDTFLVDYAAGADANGYRYVCVEELTDGVMYVAEVKVYVDMEDIATSFGNLSFATEDNTLAITGKIANGFDLANAYLLVFGYEAGGALTQAVAQEVTLPTGVLSADFSVNVDISALDGCDSISVAMVETLESMNLLFYVQDALSAAAPVTYNRTTAEAFDMTVQQNIEGAQVEGVTPVSPIMLTLLAKDADFAALEAATVGSQILWSGLVDANTAGAFSVTIPMDSDLATGDYKLMASCDGVSAEERTETLSYASMAQFVADFQAVTADTFITTLTNYQIFYADLMPALSAEGADLAADFLLAKACAESGRINETITGLAQAKDVRTLLEAALLIHATKTTEDFDIAVDLYKNCMPLIFTADYNAAEFESILNDIKEDETLTTADALLDAYEKSMGLSLILNGSYEERAKAITEYGSVLGIEEDTIGDADVLAIAKKLGNTERDIAKYADGMDATVSSIVKQLKQSDNDAGYIGGGRGSGRGGSSGVEYYPIVEKPVASESAPKDEMEAPVQIDTGVYEDIASYTWAVPSILRLTDAGIVNGVSANSFLPQGALKREEAVKLLSLAFGLAGGAENEVYADVSLDSWYHAYVDAASKNGVVKGIDRTHFGVGYTITRQDLAVMIYRALATAGKQIEVEQTANFSDMDKVADYAQEAVLALAANGIINGIEEGIFSPLGEVTRAQAVVMIDRTLQQFGLAIPGIQ